MNDSDITRLVVGESITVRRGVPARTEGDTSPNALRLRRAGEGPTIDPVVLVKSLLPTSAAVRQLRLRPEAWLLACAIAVLGAAAAVLSMRTPDDPLPRHTLAPVIAAPVPVPVAVTVVDAPFEQLEGAVAPDSPLPPQVATAAAIPLLPAAAAATRAEQKVAAAPPPPPSPPVKPAQGAQPAEKVSASVQVPLPAPKPPAAPPPIPLPKSSPPPPVRVAPESKVDDKTKSPAVVIDEAPTKPASVAPPSAKPVVAAAAPSAPGNAVPVQPPAVKAERGAGLVAITPDGKTAVFSNPKTRLPEQFKLGDQLPNGEKLKAIDAKTGKVTTTAKEYVLE